MSKFLSLCVLFLFPLAGFSQTPPFSTHNVQIQNSNSIQAIGDLNTDGYQDLVVFSVGGITAPRTFSVLLSKGDGAYRAPITYTLPTGSEVTTAVLADFNGDGKLDMVVESAYSGCFSIYLGNGDGTFRAPIAHSVTEPLPVVASIAAADVNGDSKTDLLIETTDQRSDYDLQLFFSNGDGTFTAGPITDNLVGGVLLTVDFNGDGKTDFASNYGDYSGSQLEIWFGDGTGNFKMSYSDGSVENFEYVAADLNGDGISDIIATANQYCSSCTNNVALEPYFTVYYGRAMARWSALRSR